MGAIQKQSPHYTSGRYSAHHLTQGYQRVLNSPHEHEAGFHQARSTTPPPKTPVIPSSAFTEDSVPSTVPASVGLGDYTHLTIPDPDDDDDACGVVRSVAVPNPFKPAAEEHGHLIAQKRAMDVLYEGGEDQGSTKPRAADPSRGVDRPPFPDTRSVRGSNGRGFFKTLVFAKLVTGKSTRGNGEEEPVVEEPQSVDEEQPAEDEPAAGDAVDEGEEDPSNSPAKDEGADLDYETNDDWDQHDEVKKRLGEYKRFRDSVAGHEKWTDTQAHLHKLIALRGSWPMLKRSWTFHFKMRNIYPWVYAPEGSNKRVAINAKSNEFRAVKALEALFDLSPLICSYRKIGMESRIGPSIRKAIERHIDWAIRDGGLEDREYLPTVKVYEFDPADYAVPDADSNPGSEPDDSDPISDAVEKRLRKLAGEHRRSLVLPEAEDLAEEDWVYQSQPPLLFAFVIVQQMVMILNLDSSLPNNEIVVFAEIDMSETDQWLWNALAITLPVHVARDALWDIKDTLPIGEPMEVDDSDE